MENLKSGLKKLAYKSELINSIHFNFKKDESLEEGGYFWGFVHFVDGGCEQFNGVNDLNKQINDLTDWLIG